MSLASVHVLTNDELVRSTTAFIPGVLHIVGGFKDHEFEEQLKRRPKNDLTGIRVLIWHPFVIEMTDQQLLVWQVAVRNENKRVLAALNEPSKTPRYDTVPHVLCVGIMGFTIASSQDVEFLEWIYTNFSERHRHQISVYELEAAGSLGTIEVVRWAQSHGYAVPPNMMDVAAGSGHLDFVRYLHDIGSNEGCSDQALSWTLARGHIDVVRFLLVNRDVRCLFYDIDDATAHGLLGSIKFTHKQNLPVLTQNLMHEAAIHGYLDIVKFLHENRIGFCYEDVIRETRGNGHYDVVSYLPAPFSEEPRS